MFIKVYLIFLAIIMLVSMATIMYSLGYMAGVKEPSPQILPCNRGFNKVCKDIKVYPHKEDTLFWRI